MFVKQLYTSCLSEAAYFIASEGEAAVIDPLRDIDVYLELAEQQQASIKYIFETHLHADFVSGHLDLAARTGATIVYGPEAATAFEVHTAGDGEEFNIGKLTIEAIHTPGHTIESTCYLLKDESRQPYCLFTGDTLFVGDVGRPDLFSGDLPKEQLAGYLYNSLQKLATLPDNLIIYPAHGPGSACGKNLGSATSSTIGEQKADNYAFQLKDKDEFILKLLDGLNPAPEYFPVNAKINQQGYASLPEVLEKSKKALALKEFKQRCTEGSVILDIRSGESFAERFIPGALNIGLDGRFAEWVAKLIAHYQQLLLVADDDKAAEEAIVRMARVGFENVTGFLKGGMPTWIEAGEKTDMIINVATEELAMDMPYDQNLIVLDVRKAEEFEEGHVKGALNIDLADMTDPLNIAQLDEHHNLYIHCQAGYRSMIACSLLKREGFHNLRNVEGGYERLRKTKGIPTVKEITADEEDA